MLAKLAGFFLAPGLSLTALATRLLAGLVISGGLIWGVEKAWTNWTSSICKAEVSDVVLKEKDATIAELEKANKAQAEQLKNLDQRRANAELASQEADAVAAEAQAKMKALEAAQGTIFIPDDHIDLLNGTLSALAKGGKK